MTPRSFAVLSLSVFLLSSSPLLALEAGQAEGGATINKKPLKLKYAYAKKEKDYDKKDHWVVMVTDRAVSRAMLNDNNRVSKAVDAGELSYAMLQFDETKKLTQAEVKTTMLKHKGMPLSTSKFTITPKFSATGIEGAAATTEPMEFFDELATLDIKFNAVLGDEKYGTNPLAAKEIAKTAPKIADGQAAGTLKIDGKSVKLTNAIARTKRNMFDDKKKDVVVLLSQAPVTPEVFADERQLFDAVEKGTVSGLLVTIDQDEKPYHLQVLSGPSSMQLSGSGIFNFDATDYSQQHVEGKFFTTEEQTFMDKHKYSYDVSFKAPVQTIAVLSELTIDETSGTKLPANGGDPGKAYMAFDKAARAGNFNEMKKAASKARPLPDLSAEEMKQMIEMMKAMRPASVKVVGGYTSGDHATLNVTAVESESKAKMKGTIEMTKEADGWKLLAEKWSQ